MKRLLPILFIAGVALLTACSGDIVYSRFYPITYADGVTSLSQEWHQDSVVRFVVPIADTTVDYRTIVYVRHTERYPYQNMWLFVDDGLRRDTIEFYLADDRGQWLGDTHNGVMEMPVLLDENRHFTDTGMYELRITHGMRDTLLRGISDVGLEVIRNSKE